MQIKELTLENIRSFKNTTTFNFAPNTNIIIGKNGSGKSNILAAIRYLLSHASRSSLEERQSFIYEGSHNSELLGKILIKFDNRNKKFPSESEFTIKKEISIKKEEYFLNDKIITKEELNAMFETAGIPINSKYFIVPQGEVDRLSLMNDKERFSLIKEISGVTNYEEEKDKFTLQLNETEEMKKKVFIFNEKIDQKLEKLRKEQRKLILVEKLEEEKNSLEKMLHEREIEQINLEIKKLQNLFTEEEDGKQNDLLETRIQIKKLKEEKEEYINLLKNEINFDSSEEIKNNDLEKNIDSLKKDSNEIKEMEKKEEKNFLNLTNEIEETKINILTKEMEINFLKSNLEINSFTNKEIEETKEEIKLTEEKIKQKDTKEEIFDPKKYEKYINERKKAWIEENQVENKIKRQENEMKKIENAILVNYGISEGIMKEIKEHSGVYGCVFELINIPEELYLPVSSIMGKNFFNIVVENEDVATDLFKVIKNRVTFIALNRIKEDDKIINDENMIPLYQQIETEEKFKPMLRFLLKNTFLVSDIKYALSQKKKYNVNMVTLEGEFISKNGIITGGYDDKKNIFIEFKYLQKEITKLKKEISEIKKKISFYNEAINSEQRKKNQIKNEEDFLFNKAKILFLKRKLVFMNKGFSGKEIKNTLNELENYKIKKDRLETEKDKTELRITEIKELFYKEKKKEENYESKIKLKETKRKLEELENKMAEAKEKEKKIIFRISDTNENDNNKKISDLKSILSEKRNKILTKIASLQISKDFKKSKYSDKTDSEINEEIKNLSSKKNEYKGVNYKASIQLKEMEIQQNNLKTRMTELENSKVQIENFLKELDLKKETIIESTFNLIKEGFIYFLERLNPFLIINLIKEKETICIYNNGTKTNATLFSGGQRTVIALSLLFSIQRIDPAPFYLFDEIDANLDYETRIRLSELIKYTSSLNNSPQFIFTTFKKELLNCGNEYFFINFQDKKSSFRKIDEEEANKIIDE